MGRPALSFLLAVLATVLLRSSGSATQCSGPHYDWWTRRIPAGDRGFYVVQHGAAGGSMTCMAKGGRAADEVLDPVVHTTAYIANFNQASVMPCAILRDAFQKPGVAPLQPPSGGSVVAVTGTRTCHMLGTPSVCSYPNAASGQNSWGGLKFKISMVNNNHTTESTGDPSVAYENGNTGVPNKIGHSFSHAPVFGGTRESCAMPDGSGHRYTSGVVFENSPLPYDMKYKIYAFVNEAERQLALADTRNEGLQYARAMKGENGCDVEIVFEFFPRRGGGLWVELSQTMGDMNAPTGDPSHLITDSTEAYAVPAENYAVVRVSRSAIWKYQHLPLPAGCNDEKMTIIKFSTQFICKATGKRVNISRITMSRTHAGGKYEHDMSTDPANPTTFQVHPGTPTDCYRRMDCAGHQHAPDFRLYMDAAQAPESCGSFYWDPLIHAVSGDGQSASAILGSGSGSGSGSAAVTSGGTASGWPSAGKASLGAASAGSAGGTSSGRSSLTHHARAMALGLAVWAAMNEI